MTCNHKCAQGKFCTCKLPTEYADYDYEFDDSVFGQIGHALAGLLAAFGVCLVLIGIAVYLLNRT